MKKDDAYKATAISCIASLYSRGHYLREMVTMVRWQMQACNIAGAMVVEVIFLVFLDTVLFIIPKIQVGSFSNCSSSYK